MQTDFDWDGFKKKRFAVICYTDKEKFFAECKENGISTCMLNNRVKKRNYFVCVRRYENRVSNGRYELFAIDKWQIEPNGLYGKNGLQEVKYEIG